MTRVVTRWCNKLSGLVQSESENSKYGCQVFANNERMEILKEDVARFVLGESKEEGVGRNPE